MKSTAAVLIETGRPLELVELEVPKLQPGQVLINVKYSGVCRTQVFECRGYRGEDRFLPHCLGHEGTGEVVETGSNVTKVTVGDNVVLSWMKGSGADVPGTVYTSNGVEINAGAITTFMNYSVLSENRLTRIEKDVPLEESALIGCAVPTGIGVLRNSVQVKGGDSVVVYGVGGIGQCVVQGAKIIGCSEIIAVDVDSYKLNLAKKLGATHAINALEEEPVSRVNDIVPGGADYAIEATGKPTVMEQAIRSVRNRGGSVVVIGNSKHGERLSIDPGELNMGKRIIGTWGGDNDPDKDFPIYLDMLRSGKLDLKPLISKVYELEKVNDAIDELEAGEVIRPLIRTSNGAV